MSKEMLVIAFGLLTALTTQLGIPSSWKMLIVLVFGLATALVGFLLRGETLTRHSAKGGRSRNTSFAESLPADPDPSGLTSLN